MPDAPLSPPAPRFVRVLRLTPAQYGLVLHCVVEQMISSQGIQVYHAFTPQEDCTPSELITVLMDAAIELAAEPEGE